MANDSTTKKVLLAAPRGYCAGVDRAVVAVQKALEVYGAPVYVRKQIVHNKYVVESLEKHGAIFVEEVNEVPEGATVVFSAHGVSPQVHADSATRNLKTIDATCPLVTKVHNEARRYANEDLEIIMIGHDGHEEVEGTAGEAPGRVTVIEGVEMARTMQPKPGKKLAWLSQTTLSVDETMETVAELKKRFPEIIDPPSDDICYATQNRQEAMKQIAPRCDLVLVVGSKNSSNSVRLVEVAKDYGAKNAYLIDYVHEADSNWLHDVNTVGVSSGASVPELLVEDLLKWLADRGFGNVETVTAKEETLLFQLPRELRKDLKNS